MKHADDSVHGENDLLKPALVLGGGITGLIAARALLNVGIPVTLIAAPQPPDQMICASSAFKQDDFLSALREATQEATVIEVSTWPAIRRDGHLFRARIDHEEEAVFGCLLVAPEVSLAPADSSLPEEAQPISLQGIPDSPCAVAFLLDYSTQSAPAAGMLAMRQALENALKGGQSFVLFKHAPVVHLFGEALYEEARDAGVRFHRFGTELPRVEPIEDASEPSNLFRITVNDVVEAGEPVTFDCEKIVAATYPDASSLPGHARDIADGELDTDGFLLSESIHCHSGCSFRNGVFAIGGATGSLDLLQTLAQASAAAVRARGWMLQAASTAQIETVTVGEDCCRCLTCSRVCPHAAITLHTETARSKIRVSAPLCRECGVCVSECPRMVLDLAQTPEVGIADFLDELRQSQAENPVALYGCQRSAGKLAAAVELPKSVVPFSVPCAGRISEEVLWATLAAGARGVLVVGCHHGNCPSDTGTGWARSHVTRLLNSLGFSHGADAPVRYETVAPNEHARFARVVADFAGSIDINSARESWFRGTG